MNPRRDDVVRDWVERWVEATGGHPNDAGYLLIEGTTVLPSVFPVADFCSASVGTAGLAAAALARALGAAPAAVTVDRGLTAHWFGTSLIPQGWKVPPAWDALAGDYPTSGGWIRLHTNAAHHRRAALAALGLPADTASRTEVADVVARWRAKDLEEAVVAAGGCAARMLTKAQWRAHPQGSAVASEPLVHWRERAPREPRAATGTPERPLRGVKVLDLTRVLAGPVATRFLAGLGADVLRIDPPGWSEPSIEPDTTLGKRCARLDLTVPGDREIFSGLLAEADILVHGYRPSALDRLGFGDDELAERHPGLVNLSLNAYGWTGPWADRRGFDSLVQMSSGIADAGMRATVSAVPRPLPVQALDHATGHLLAAAALNAWSARLGGRVFQARLSLARTATELLAVHGAGLDDGTSVPPAASFRSTPEETAWGPALRLEPPVHFAGTRIEWHLPARGTGSADARWQ
ncbi:CoA transferase [Paenarthrobacter sp. DKR-5]|uniref:CoA transferase n=1 Tax=Paenarthrobacter sp. DKR-5 TaxID=2835535 RepID=UPI001BDC4811|nr:CoA transferase [Paenarthrobacter sp. DKR-5]MBT1002566.1 CoA transferase [Paenarthrobacter sp. DKR-5]